FLYGATNFEVNELLSLCHGDYINDMAILITKKNANRVFLLNIMTKLFSRPLLIVLFLAYHPSSKVKLHGVFKYVFVRLLKKNPFLLSVARKIYYRWRG
ncbi:hypothetical protein, partial [Citrobacter sp. Igbk 16]|uniref:hypothetical protein n=2 Tax=unclassified Citrobacter TaxID=2644389 RepID=UPI00230319A8